MPSRLAFALDTGAVELPPNGDIAVFNASVGEDLSALSKDRVQAIQTHYGAFRDLDAAGYRALTAAEPPCAAAVLHVPRSRALARAMIAEAREATDGPVIVDGPKTNGIDSLLKDLRGRADVSSPVSKAHGKVFTVTGGAFPEWRATFADLDGFWTLPGVFSADGPDRGSKLLAGTIGDKLSGRGADLGAGWGYLSHAVLRSREVVELHIIEADLRALDCARRNIDDQRARFHWADVTSFQPERPLDFVVTNPPFHKERAGDPRLGQAFIKSAAAMLGRGGSLWLVANRHLPYEQTLANAFTDVTEIGGDAGFKVMRADRPRLQRRS